jgi:ABC-type nitrate/sulfonate/bicarbonate transport system permease component
MAGIPERLQRVAPTQSWVASLRGSNSKERTVLGLLGLVMILTLWEAVVLLGLVDVRFSSSPTRVIQAGIDYFAKGSGLEDLAVTAKEFSWGFFGAIFAGIVLGLLMGWFRRLEALLDPIVNFAYTSPRPALFPLFVIWFGIGMESKIALVFVSAIFPVVIATAVGVRTVDRSLLNVAWSFNGSTLQIFRTIVLPSSVPHIVSGVRVALGHALTAVIFGEMVVANQGVGYTMGIAANTFNTDLVFCGFFLVGAIGVGVAELLRKVERRLETWRPAIQR